MAIRTILAPVAGTAIDERVMETAFRMAKRFDAHLEALSQGFGVSEPIAQLPLFPAVGLRRSEAPADAEGVIWIDELGVY